MGRRYLQEAGRKLGFRVGPFRVGHHDVTIFNDWDHPPDDRQHDVLATKFGRSRVVWIHRYCGIAEHGFGPGRRHGDMARAILERIAQVPHVPLHLFHLDLIVGERSAGDRVPVDESLTAIDESVFEQDVERVTHRGGTHFVHGETGAVVVAARAHLAQLPEDDLLVVVLPLLGLFDKRFTAHFETARSLLEEPLFDHRLGRDAGVIGAGHPHGVCALHPVVSHEHILERVVERMTEVQRRGYIRRRDHHRVLCRGRVGVGLGVKGLVLRPDGADQVFGLARDVDLCQFGKGVAHSDRIRRVSWVLFDSLFPLVGQSVEVGLDARGFLNPQLELFAIEDVDHEVAFGNERCVACFSGQQSGFAEDRRRPGDRDLFSFATDLGRTRNDYDRLLADRSLLSEQRSGGHFDDRSESAKSGEFVLIERLIQSAQERDDGWSADAHGFLFAVAYSVSQP